jgi:hydroxyacylglutathione hydrolase
MKVHVLPTGPLQTNAYLLTAPMRHEAVLVDAPLGVWRSVQPLLEKEGCKLAELWFTHGHFDHMEGGAEVIAATQARTRAHLADQHLFEQPQGMRWFIDMFMPDHPEILPVKPELWVDQGDVFEALGKRVEVRHVPGHADGNIAFVIADEGLAFVGDSIFASGIGRTDLPGGSFERLANSIREQIYTLPDNTVLLPGHGPRTTVGTEKRENPYVR